MKAKIMAEKGFGADSGQATMELAVLLIAFTAMILGIVFIGGVGIARNEALLDAKVAAEVVSRSTGAAATMSGSEYENWSYTALDLYGDGGGSIPFSALDRARRGDGNSIGRSADEFHLASRSEPGERIADGMIFTYDYEFKSLENFDASLFEHDFATGLRGGGNALDAAELVSSVSSERNPVALIDSRNQRGSKNSAADAASMLHRSFTTWFGVRFDRFSTAADVSSRVAMPLSPVGDE